jgi:hypothetical protein
MKKRSLITLVVAAMAVMFVFAVVYATQQAPDTITMNSKVFKTHKKTLVTFSHKKHHVDYKIACTECHHNYVDGKNVWKDGDEVKKCDACHTEAKAPKGEKLAKNEMIKKYYYSAIHENCKSCHKELKTAGKPTGPTACTGCHPKKE